MTPTTPPPPPTTPMPSQPVPPTSAYSTVKVLATTHHQLKIIALVRGETLSQVMEALVRRELARLRADGRLAETLDGVVAEPVEQSVEQRPPNGHSRREERHKIR